MFRNVVVVALAAGSIQLAATVPAHAQAEGLHCGFTSVTDPTGEGDVQTGEIDGGPLAAGSLDPDAPAADPTADLRLICAIQVGPTGATYDGVDSTSASANGTGVVVLPPTQISYVSPEGFDVYICTTLVVDGTAYNYDYATGTWTQSGSAACDPAISQSVPDPTLCQDPLLTCLLCPGPANLFPPEGDVVLPDPIGKVWDCPPYGA